VTIYRYQEYKDLHSLVQVNIKIKRPRWKLNYHTLCHISISWNLELEAKYQKKVAGKKKSTWSKVKQQHPSTHFSLCQPHDPTVEYIEGVSGEIWLQVNWDIRCWLVFSLHKIMMYQKSIIEIIKFWFYPIFFILIS